MENQFILLYYLSSMTGLIMVVGGIFLLYKEKIYIDSQTQEVTALETPAGTFRTNAPALALFMIGFIPLIYPIYQSSKDKEQVKLALEQERLKQEEKVKLQGHVSAGNDTVQVYVVLDSESVNNPRDYSFKVPAHLEQEKYTVLYKLDNIIQEEMADLDNAKDGHIPLKGFKYHKNKDTENIKYQHQIDEVSDEFLN
ncbi:hypothetical protein [Candidatus Electrothrix sp.]|uniref:hypothetical protein n=1 Tax=Candidatus Electrothrix sp. TaxID=2170559 RepID=UPI004057A40C